jgi:5'-phosphate synthase pdxT subunit
MGIGVLSLQGAVEPHRQRFAAIGERADLVRTAEEILSCDGLVLPGGESTTLLNLIDHYGLWEPLREFARTRPMWGVCAGAILMARRVESPAQRSFDVLPITVRRNAYGRQNESFIAPITLRLPGQAPQEQEAVFIRAPVILETGAGCEVLAEHGGHPIAVQHGFHLVTTFHPELSSATALHRHFAMLCKSDRARQMA